MAKALRGSVQKATDPSHGRSPRTRDPMSLTVKDMQLAARLISPTGKRWLPAARLARQAGVQRSYLYRVVERLFRLAGATPPEGPADEQPFPAEVVRLARSFAPVCKDFESLKRYPRIATGRSLDILLAEFLLRMKPGWDSAMIVPARSGESVEGLLSFQFDVALGHGRAFDQVYEALMVAQPGRLDEIERVSLVRWRGLLVSPRGADDCVSIDWEPGSFAEQLSQESGEPAARRTLRVSTFSAALELARRGVAVRFVIPDLFLTNLPAEDRERLSFVDPPRVIEDSLVAIFRRQERSRLGTFLDRHRWSQVADRSL